MKRSNNKIPFGLRNGVLVDVSEVESGLACGCVCPSCHRKLQANKGQIVSHYFSHNPSDDNRVCRSAFETSIHRMAKQILGESGYVRIPELIVRVAQADATRQVHEESSQVEAETTKSFERVELEKRLDQIRPDIIAYHGGVPLLIEVAVTHFADAEKKKWIREQSLAAIEIDLSSVDFTINKDELRELVVNDVTKKKWLSNPKALEIKKRLRAELGAKIHEINEKIEKSRQKELREIQQSRLPVLPRNGYKRTNTPKRYRSIVQYKRRTFLCEGCGTLFEVTSEIAPYTLKTVECPKCGYRVSAESC